MHAAGIAHSDLKRKENILVGPDETPFLIDFGIAAARPRIAGIRIGPGFATARQMDWNAWIKLKYGGRPESLPADDANLYRPLVIERWARRLRGPWKTLSMRKLRKNRRRRQ
jgi:serine/threonine protein kinase